MLSCIYMLVFMLPTCSCGHAVYVCLCSCCMHALVIMLLTCACVHVACVRMCSCCIYVCLCSCCVRVRVFMLHAYAHDSVKMVYRDFYLSLFVPHLCHNSMAH